MELLVIVALLAVLTAVPAWGQCMYGSSGGGGSV